MTNQDYISRQQLLESVSLQLKKEFFGIDKVIDQLVSNVSYWYFMPDLLKKPTIINLWGLTGVGKTSLINRLVELIDFKDRYYRFNLGDDETDEWSIKKKLGDISEYKNGEPVIICFDEFQHARTISENGMERNKDKTRIVWELLDSGLAPVIGSQYAASYIIRLIEDLQYMLLAGVVVQGGEVIGKVDYFKKKMNVDTPDVDDPDNISRDTNKVYFIKERPRFYLYEMVGNDYKNQFELDEFLNTLDGWESIAFLEQALRSSYSTKFADCRQGLFFVLGNLDEAYKISNNYNPDLSADIFHEASLKITTPLIKDALKQRFRNEQVARLGNTHIIYPALNRNAYLTIISNKLQEIQKDVKDNSGYSLSFEPSITDLLYSEGVYPTQGVRPLLSSISQLIHSNIPRIIAHALIHKVQVDCIRISAGENCMHAHYIKGERTLTSLLMPCEFELQQLRSPLKDDMQAITAVHESGHVLLSSLLLRLLPETGVSRSVDADSVGFAFTRFKWKYISKQEIIKRLAHIMGGYVAEMVVFGEDKMTAGSDADILEATKLINNMIRSQGFGAFPLATSAVDAERVEYVWENDATNADIAKDWIMKALNLAKKTLTENKVLLLEMADYLSDHNAIDKSMIRNIIEKHKPELGSDFFIEKGDNLYYRAELKRQVQQSREANASNFCPDSVSIMLNRKS